MVKLIALLLWITLLFLSFALVPQRKSILSQLHKFTSWQPQQVKSLDKKSLLKVIASHTPKEWGKSRNLELMRANIPLTGGELFVLQVAIASTLAFLAFIVTLNLLVVVVILTIGWFLPLLYVNSARNKQLKIFNSQLADALAMMANGLKSGFSFQQAMDMASKEMPAPLSVEWGITLKEMQMGAPTEQALATLSERVGSADLDLMITAISIQRQVGGNLSEVLENIHDTIQERIRMKSEIKALTAQGRISGYMISALPFIIAILVLFINPNYMKALISEPIGWYMIGGGLVSQAIGFMFIRKIVDIKV